MEKEITAALIYDFDGTLSPGNMQEYDFIPTVGKSNAEFWEESNRIAAAHDADPILAYLYKMLQFANEKQMPIKRERLVESGRNVQLYDGVKEWFGRMNEYAAERGIKLLHYINSSGLREIIEGTSIAHEFKNIFACSFLYNEQGEATWPGVALNYTNKTQFLYKINKGVESVSDSKLVNSYVPDEDRFIRFEHMIYIGDCKTDIPCMRLVRFRGGHSIAVYQPDSKVHEANAKLMCRQGRSNFACPADYTEGSCIDTVVKTIIDKIYIDNRLKQLAGE